MKEEDVYPAIGEEGFARLIRAFYAQVPGDPILGPMYPADDLPGAEQRLRDFVVGRWKGGGTHTGPAFSDFLIGSLPAASGQRMHFTGTTVLRVENGRIAEEVGLDDGVTALQQLGLIRAA